MKEREGSGEGGADGRRVRSLLNAASSVLTVMRCSV